MGAGKENKRLEAIGKRVGLGILPAVVGSLLPAWVMAQSVAPPSLPPVITPPTPQVNPVIPVVPPSVFQPPVIIPVRDFMPPLIPTDYTGPTRFREEIPFPQGPGASNVPTGGVKKLNPEAFRIPEGDADGILVKARAKTRFSRPSLKSVQLEDGAVLVSVRKPCDIGLVTTPHASVSIATGADVIVEYREGVLRVFNLTGIGEAVKVQIHATSVSARLASNSAGIGSSEGEEVAIAQQIPGKIDNTDKAAPTAFTLALKLSHEIVFADRPLEATDLRPADGIARRGTCLLESNLLCVSEFSLESALSSCDMILDLQQAVSGVRERRVLSDMAKMASVLNFVNGSQGFVASRKSEKP
jgi:hypothetical protein